MALTEENVAKLPSDGSPFYSSYSFTSKSSKITSPVVAPFIVRLQQAKESAYLYMYGLRGLGPEGRRILRDDELYIAGRFDIRFRDRGRHTQDIDNLDFWEAKAVFFREKFQPLYDAKHPPIVIDPESPGQIEQTEMDRAYFRWARRKKFIETWISTTGQEHHTSRIVDSNTPPQRPIPPLNSPCFTTTNLPSVPQTHPEDAPAAVSTGPRALKRKRPSLEHEDQSPSSKKCVQEHTCQEIGTRKAKESTKTKRARKRTPRSLENRPVTLRRSARIAALPKIKYPQ
ncbi:hypothetical protein F5Y09DRAFT_339458 [Xylaria sp. FL1042]|nr:hypothetical protein F5Y09DRAFT_339458 [Xylaria sp. FL1042]